MTAQKITLTGESYVASHYSATGRTVHGVGVTVGPFGATGRTVTAARQATEQQVTAYLAAYMQVGSAPIVACYGGWTSVTTLSAVCDDDGAAWTTIVIGPDGVRGGQSSHDLTDRAEANAQARFRLVQRVTDWHDDASVWAGADYLDALFAGHEEYGSASHLRYAAWQRAAKVTLESGVADWHEQASAQQAAHTVPARCDA